MLSREQIRDALAQGLATHAIPYRLFTWEWSSEQVRFHVYLEFLPEQERARIEVYFAPLRMREVEGFDLVGNSFPFYVLARRLPLGVECDVESVENCGNGVYSDQERLALFQVIGDALGEYITTHSSEESLVKAYANGDYNTAFIHPSLKPAFDQRLEAVGIPAPHVECTPANWMNFFR